MPTNVRVLLARAYVCPALKDLTEALKGLKKALKTLWYPVG